MVALEYLSALTRRAVEEGRYDLYNMGGAKVKSHLAFTNDVIFFGCAFTETFNTLKQILGMLSNFSSLEIKKDKKYMIFFSHVNDGHELAIKLGFQVRFLPSFILVFLS